MSVPSDPVERVNYFRQKVLTNEEISDEELQEAVSLLRSEQADNIKQSKAEAEMPEDLKDWFK